MDGARTETESVSAWSKMRSGSIVLPEGICGKVEGFGEGRTGGTAEPKPEGFGANAPGPLGFRAAGARETELIEPDLILL
jgi:hypothetical protein